MSPDWFIFVKRGEGVSVMAMFYGGYLDGDAWRVSTNIESVEKDGELTICTTLSGSTYVLREDNYQWHQVMPVLPDDERVFGSFSEGLEAIGSLLEEGNDEASSS